MKAKMISIRMSDETLDLIQRIKLMNRSDLSKPTTTGIIEVAVKKLYIEEYKKLKKDQDNS